MFSNVGGRGTMSWGNATYGTICFFIFAAIIVILVFASAAASHEFFLRLEAVV